MRPRDVASWGSSIAARYGCDSLSHRLRGPIPADHPPGRYVGSLWLVEHGGGQPWVLLHGNSQDHHAFDRLAPLLARPGRRIIGIDARDHGRSPRGDGPLTIETMADDIAAVLDELDLRDVVIVGFSDGGNVALELVVRYPERIRAVVTCGANLNPQGLTSRALSRVQVPHRIAAWIADRGDRMQGRPRRPSLARRAEERLRLMAYDPQIRVDSLSSVAQPVLVVVGEHDVVRPEHTRLIATTLPRGEQAILRGGFHMLPRSHPSQLAARIERFIAPLS